jgi:hypothetical protein
LKIYNFLKSSKTVDESLTSHHNETETLKKAVDHLHSILRNETVKNYGTGALWADAQDGLTACQTTVQTLLGKVTSIQDTQLGGNWTSHIAKQGKLDFHDNKMREMRGQIHTHVAVIQAVLEMITLKVVVRTPNVVIESLSPKIDNLERMVRDIDIRPATENDSLQQTGDLADDVGSDNEHQNKMALNFLSKGQQKYQEGDCAKAESRLRKAMIKLESRGRALVNVKSMDIKLQIAKACHSQDKLIEAKEFCEVDKDPLYSGRTSLLGRAPNTLVSLNALVLGDQRRMEQRNQDTVCDCLRQRMLEPCCEMSTWQV